LKMVEPAKPLFLIVDMAIVERVTSDALFQASVTWREQAYHACRILRDLAPVIPYSVIGKLFGVRGGTVKDAADKYKQRGNETGGVHASVLSDDHINYAVQLVLESFVKGLPLTLQQVHEQVQEHFHIDVIPDTLYRRLLKDQRIKSCKAPPMDGKRMDVTTEQIREYFHILESTVSGAPAHFVFNLDEMGHQPWADAKKRKCFVPADASPDSVRYPTSRTGKRITLVACICADGSYVRPTLIINTKNYSDDAFIHGLTHEKIEIYTQDKAYMIRDIFEDWVKCTLIPELARRRIFFDYWGPAFLIMDNCSSHSGEIFRVLCNENGIIPVLLPPHASNQLQMLDLCLFAVTKRKIEYLNQAIKKTSPIHHIVTVTNGFISAATPENIVASFRNGGVSLVLDDGGLIRCQITPTTARCLLQSPIPELPEATDDDEDLSMAEFYEQCADLIMGLVPDDMLSLEQLAERYPEVCIAFGREEREPVREEPDPLTAEQRETIQRNCAHMAEKYWPWHATA
jgi:hypothetical protein